uniref:Uncharacterized protein n=1 Tax=Pithovirus LCPAC302 TaxID=2506593 RepID=A0A481Z735_9VIRU|nr:MAG: hypothetical protein LCPAC302_01970 [Pithovirus LCPAC302]
MNETHEIDYSYEHFDGNKLEVIKPKPKSFESQNGKVSYNEIPLQYNYGSPTSPIVDSCLVELPIVTSFGWKCEEKTYAPRNETDMPYVKRSYSIMLSFDLQDKECLSCLDKMEELHKSTARQLAKYKGDVGMHHFNPEHPESGSFKNPVYWKMEIDKTSNTFERVKGVNPSMWVKMNNWKNNKTLFTDLNENPIDWSLLTNVELKMVPLIHFEKIYIGGGKASLQVKLVSAVVVDIIPINTRTKQTRTLDRLRKKHGDLADKVASQLAQLRMDKQDVLDTNTTMSSIPHETAEMHKIPFSSHATTTQDSEADLNEFLGAAPTIKPIQTDVVSSLQQTVQIPTQSQPVQLKPVTLQTGQPTLQIQ